MNNFIEPLVDEVNIKPCQQQKENNVIKIKYDNQIQKGIYFRSPLTYNWLNISNMQYVLKTPKDKIEWSSEYQQKVIKDSLILSRITERKNNIFYMFMLYIICRNPFNIFKQIEEAKNKEWLDISINLDLKWLHWQNPLYYKRQIIKAEIKDKTSKKQLYAKSITQLDINNIKEVSKWTNEIGLKERYLDYHHYVTNKDIFDMFVENGFTVDIMSKKEEREIKKELKLSLKGNHFKC